MAELEDRQEAQPAPGGDQESPFGGMSPQEMFGHEAGGQAVRVSDNGQGTHTFIVGGTNDRGAGVYGDLAHNNDATVIDYPASIVPFGGVQTHDESVRIGSQNLENAVRSFLDANPNAHAKITGYSLGAEIAGNVLQNLGGSQYSGRIDGDLYGDPRRPGGLADGISDLPQLGITMGDSRGNYGGIPVDQHYIPGDPIADYQGADFAQGDLNNAQNTLNGYFERHTNMNYGPLIKSTLHD